MKYPRVVKRFLSWKQVSLIPDNMCLMLKPYFFSLQYPEKGFEVINVGFASEKHIGAFGTRVTAGR